MPLGKRPKTPSFGAYFLTGTMDHKNARRMADAVSIAVRTKYVISFEDFLSQVDQSKLSVSMPSSSGGRNADFAFHWVFIDLKGGQSLEGTLTLKHLLYLYYHHIFGIPVYVISEWADKYVIINEYERITAWLPVPENGKLPMRRIANGAKIFPVRIWQEGDEFFEEVKKILKEFAPNREYDKKETEMTAELSLQTGEIFEYFLSASKYPSLSTEDTRKKLSEMNLDVANLSDETLKKRMDFVDRFLFHIFW